MGKRYVSGLIGLDVKHRRIHRVRRNRMKRNAPWLVTVAVALVIGLFILANVR